MKLDRVWKQREAHYYYLDSVQWGLSLSGLDDYSDLDFFVIVKPEYKSRFIERLDWLEAVHPLAFSFRNTKDGHKILFEDGIYAEFAIFEEKEMEHISFSEGRIVWQEAHFINKDLHIPYGSKCFVKKRTLTGLFNK